MTDDLPTAQQLTNVKNPPKVDIKDPVPAPSPFADEGDSVRQEDGVQSTGEIDPDLPVVEVPYTVDDRGRLISNATGEEWTDDETIEHFGVEALPPERRPSDD